MLQFSSISFDIAIEELYPTWSSGGAVVLKDADFSLGFAELMQFVRKYGITALDLPTAYWHEWTNFLFDNRQLPPQSLRLVIVGGEKVSAAILARWQSRVGKSIRWVNTYGPSEASVIATAFEPEGIGELPQVPIGRPIANAKIYLLDRSMDLVPIGEAGELYIGGVGVALGYLNRPELSAEKFVADPFSSNPDARLYRTGDMARYRPDGVIEFLGREDDQVKIRGFRVEPGEIEDVLSRHASVREAAVVARAGESGEKRLVAYIVCAKGATVSDAELREYLKNQLPDYMVPSVFVMLDAMPTTPNGKVDRRSLPEPKPEVIPQPTNGSDPLQAQVARIWQEVLGRSVGLQDNFFEVGGHSLLAAKLMHRVGQTVGKTLPLAMLLEAPTIEQLSSALRQNGWSRHWCSLVPIQTQGSRAPFFCIHGVGGNVVGFRDLGAHMGPTHPFYGLQSRGLDGKHDNPVSIEEMAAHYLGEVRTVQPKGPYLLGGFSFGGLVAYEMSRQLLAQDEDVALLALFDTYPGNLKPMGSSLLKALKSPIRLMIEIPRFARRRARLFWRRITVPKTLREVFRANSRAANKYVLQPYQGKVTLFRASEKSLRSEADPHAAWHNLAKGGLEFQDIPGDHYGILVEPEVTYLSEKLKACIDQALAEHQALAVQGSPAEMV
jgi:aspartate racemase